MQKMINSVIDFADGIRTPWVQIVVMFSITMTFAFVLWVAIFTIAIVLFAFPLVVVPIVVGIILYAWYVAIKQYKNRHSK